MYHENEYVLKQRIQELQEGYKRYQSERWEVSAKLRKVRSFWKKLLTRLAGSGESVVSSKGSKQASFSLRK